MSVYLLLFLEFFKMGALTFGGGYAMIPFIEETVLAHGWMTTEELVDFIAVSESTPGAFAVNISTYIGSEVGGILGAVLATLGLVLPPFIIIILIAKVYEKIKENRLVQGAMLGLKATVVGLIAATVLSVGKEIFFSKGINIVAFQSANIYVSLGIFAVALFLLLYKKLNPILIIVGSAVVGIIFGYTGVITV
ncbi:MAG: chromate transporter [Ruminococcus sp.]|uniref:chromate transporter n=1 Tax=Ruminococcus sp. TaxID=41978 RepID=UPI002872BDD1|nr:chromate transporter [Ruminococcus sp.]MBQ3284278.1 chromate transporter [Ruminococcus sp.]